MNDRAPVPSPDLASLAPAVPFSRRGVIASSVDAGVARYGSLSPAGANTATPMDVTDKLNPPVLGLNGGEDQGIPLQFVERLRAGLLAFGKDKESIIHVYPEAGHAFNADCRASYRKAEAEDGWKRMPAWLKKHGV